MESFYWDCCRVISTIARDGQVTSQIAPPFIDAGESKSLYLSQGSLPGADGCFPARHTITDPIGREKYSIHYVANGEAGNAVSGYHAQTNTTVYPFGTSHHRVTTDPLGVVTTNFVLLVTWDMSEKITTSESVYDFLGRVVATVTPLGITSNFYDSATGKVTKTTRTEAADTIYVYNALGEQIVSSLDVNGNNVADYAGLDRINKVERIYELRSNDWWQVTYNMVWAETNSATCITSSISRVRMTGLGEDTYNGGILTAQSESEDWLGNITRSSTYTDAANATTWQIVDASTSTQDSIQKSIAGYPVQAISTTSVTNTFTYDGYARQVAATDGRTNTTFTVYNDIGQVSYTQSSTNKTYYFYNGLGQRVAVSNAFGQVSHTAYNLRGQTIATWGTSYPVAYEFDTSGRMIALATTRSNAYANVNLNTLITSGDTLRDCNIPALDITRWYYDETIGLLTNKVYADGNGTVYTYTETGKIATRTWARGKTTAYTYNNLGQLTNVDYSDSTPDITFAHDRLGRVLSAISSASTSTFYYDGLTFDYETQNGYIIKRKQDTLGREIGYELYNPADPINPVKKIIYGYDAFNRLSTITSIIGTETNTFTYTYIQGTDFVNAMSSDSGVQWSRYYESERNLITAVSNSWDSTMISSFDYINDPLDRRTWRADYYNGSTIINDFIYNIRGEVIGAIMGNDNHGYSNDPIGNRKQSTVYNGQSTVTNLYTVNHLNQYSSVTTAGSVVALTYDLDGNLTFDGSQWNHSWDAENHLITSSNTVSGVYCEYAYDYQSRRISKTTLTPSPYSSLTTKYIWDGWNIAAEIIIDQTIFTSNVNYYTWGLDLSGTLQVAGGVGGLLVETKTTPSSTNTYYALGDASGNVTEYIDNTGAVKAHYKYNAFGEITAQSGSMSDDFVFRFSTKYRDAETSLYYYGYRYYDVVLMRWLSRDPIEEQGGNNLYAFVDNCPIGFIDPIGFAACSYAVGLCSRNVAGVNVPHNVVLHGRTFTIPNWARNTVNHVVPDHHDVRVESYTSTDCTGKAEDTLSRGFFANNFNDAISHYAVSLIPFTKEGGWVEGHVDNSSDPGPCSMTCVSKKQYEMVKERISSSTASRYHLTRYNCQTWAAEQLR